MTGALAQQIALISYGNNFFTDQFLPADFFPGNTTFQYCNKVDFRVLRKHFLQNRYTEMVIADKPSDWFKYLKAEGCLKLRLYYEHSKDQSFAKDHKLAGFVGGGGKWLIEAVYKSYSDYWDNSWEVTDRDSPERKIWSVKYELTLKKGKPSDQKNELTICKEQLNNDLHKIIEFCVKQSLGSWEKWYKKAQDIIVAPDPKEGFYHPDMIVHKNYSLLAQQLLFAAGSAWAFGGMGSWNDVGFAEKDIQQEYEGLSEKLFETLNMVFISTINSY